LTTTQNALTINDLRDKLLAAGGRELDCTVAQGIAAPPPPVQEIELLLEIGGVMQGKVTLQHGDDCPSVNVTRLWKKKGALINIALGYALDQDGLWKQHIWGVAPGYVIVETTELHKKYFGLLWIKSACNLFAKQYSNGSSSAIFRTALCATRF
jgi:hypothetical protein